MVELFTVGLFEAACAAHPIAELVTARFRPSRARKLPTPADVERTCRDLHPNCPDESRLWSEPRGGICPPCGERTTFDCDGPAPTGKKTDECGAFLRRPASGTTHRIERGDSLDAVGAASSITSASLRRAGQAPLDASGSTGRHPHGWLGRALGSVGKAELNGMCRPSERCRAT